MLILLPVTVATALALMSLGGGLYEVAVVDPAWPRRPAIIQPAQDGLSRRQFWIPIHVAFEFMLVAALFVSWPEPSIRVWLLVALGFHAAMRFWSAFDFIPKALAFERADPASIDETVARAWTRRSRLRLILDLLVCAAMLSALVAAARLY